MSMLVGSSKVAESKVLDFVDQAVAQGLISSEYQLNDESIQFLSKAIAGFTYGSIQEEQKEELHSRIGAYQETLHAQGSFPSAATLAYHYQRSTNEEKARLYGDLQQAHNDKIFDVEEAAHYTGEKLSGGGKGGGPEDSISQLRIVDSLDWDTLANLPEIIGALLTAVEESKRSSPGSQAMIDAMGHLGTSIDQVLRKNIRLHITYLADSVLVNGERVDMTQHESTVTAFLQLMRRLQLRSITFSPGLTEQELSLMMETFGRISDETFGTGFWQHVSAEQDLPHVELKQQRGTGGPRVSSTTEYISTAPEKLRTEVGPSPELETATKTFAHRDLEEPAGRIASEDDQELKTTRQASDTILKVAAEGVELTHEFFESVADRLTDPMADEEQARQIIGQCFHDFEHQTPPIRTELIRTCDGLLDEGFITSRPQWIGLITDPLLSVLAKEEDSRILAETASLLSRTVTSLIQFGDYGQAVRILVPLRKRQQQLRKERDQPVQLEEGIFFHGLEPKAQQLLLEDLSSQDTSRMQEAVQLLDGLGSLALPMLIEIVKREDGPRIRQIASQLLGKLGREASVLLRRELVLESSPEQRVRILEIIDGVTQDLKKELAYTLEDKHFSVRQATFQLMERLKDEKLTPLLVDCAHHKEVTIAVAAIASLGKIKPTTAVEVLVSLLDSCKESERLIACCQALGRIGDPASIEPLAQIMIPRRFFSLRKRRDPRVRASAAFALTQITHPRVVEILTTYLEDSDSRIRQIAHDAVSSENSSSHI